LINYKFQKLVSSIREDGKTKNKEIATLPLAMTRKNKPKTPVSSLKEDERWENSKQLIND